jgi:hypothetical protein
MGRPCYCCGQPTVPIGSTCCLYFVASGFTGDCSQLNGIWELFPYAANVGSKPFWRPFNANPGNTTATLNWFAYRDVETGIFYLYIAYGQNHFGLFSGIGSLGDYFPRNEGWQLINSYRMCELPSFVVTLADPTVVPCNGYSSPTSITVSVVPCCQDCYSISLPFTDVKFIEVEFPSGENAEVDGYGSMVGFPTAFGPLGGGGFIFPGSNWATVTAFDSCCYHGGFTDASGKFQAEFSLAYMLSSNQAIMRVTLLNVVRGSFAEAYRWYVSNNFTLRSAGDFYLTAILDDGGLAALVDSTWRTSWNSVTAFNAAYTPGNFSNVLTDTWPNKITAAAPASCHGYTYSPPPPSCSGNCFYAAHNIAPDGYTGTNTGTPGEFVVWFEVHSGTGFPDAPPPPWPTCGAGCGCFPFESPITVPFDATAYGQYLTFCNIYGYPSRVGDLLETECV